MCISASDLAIIGLLCLNDGNYNGKQIVSKKGIYSAIGNSGKVIYINKSNNFVCGITGYFKPTVFDRVDFIQEYLDR